MAQEWTRETPWRQGLLLPDDALSELSLLGDSDSFEYAMVISHDCDLANDKLRDGQFIEPNVEVLLGHVGKPEDSGNLRWGKSPRNIHLEFTHLDGTTKLLDFHINQKRTVAKQELCRYLPQPYELSDAEHDALSRWLASRYRRAALPDAFNDALDKSNLGRKLEKRLNAPGGAAITVVFFDIREKSSREFTLTVVLVYRDHNQKDLVDEVARSINKLFREYGDEARSGDGEDKIILYECQAIHESQVTLLSMRKLKKWHKDHLSLRSDGEMVDEV